MSTTDVEKDTGTGIGKNRRTAETVGGGAALGTIIGAIAGGAKGAAIGVLVGAAGGAGVQVLNKGKTCACPQKRCSRSRSTNLRASSRNAKGRHAHIGRVFAVLSSAERDGPQREGIIQPKSRGEATMTKIYVRADEDDFLARLGPHGRGCRFRCTADAKAFDPAQIEQRYGVSGAYVGSVDTPGGSIKGTIIPITLADGRSAQLIVPQRQAGDVRSVYLSDSDGLHPVQLQDNVSRQAVIGAPAIVQRSSSRAAQPPGRGRRKC